jgi:glucose-6-phosphate isomerase
MESFQNHHKEIQKSHLRDLFADDPKRAEKMRVEALDIDYSKNRVTSETMKLLIQLAEELDLPERIAAMFRGDKINVTALHVALRAPRETSIVLDGVDVVPYVHAVLDRMAEFSNRVPLCGTSIRSTSGA